MNPWFIGYEAPINRGLHSGLGERVELDGDKLIRHAFVCGSTGSGKTVLSKAMVEEALLSGVPVVAIDLKGDLASMALHQRLQRPATLAGILGRAEAEGAQEAFQEGLASQPAAEQRWHQFPTKVDVRLFTPRSPYARQLAMSALPEIDSATDDAVEAADRRALNQSLIQGLATRMWGAKGLKRRKPELTFLEELVAWAQAQGQSLSGLDGLQTLGALVSDPPIADIGGMPIDEYLGVNALKRLRREIAAQCAGANQDWFRGEPLNMERLTAPAADGRTPLSIIYLGHVVEFDDKALVIAKVCAEIFRWMRNAGGSHKLKMLLYIDEIGGASGPTSYFPSSPYQPASKGPLGLLIRQARAFGVGVLLATQNPMSVDVQALNNIGTWAVGKLNQPNEIRRLASALSELGMSSRRLEEELSNIPTGTFLTVGEGIKRATRVDERWLSSLHLVLTPAQLRAVHAHYSTSESEAASTPSAAGRAAPVPDPSEAHVSPSLPPKNVAPQPFSFREETTPTFEPSGATEATMAPDAAPVDGEWRLIWPGGEQLLSLGESLLVGRSSSCGLTLKSDPYMSSRHAQIDVQADGVVLVSLKDANPILLGGHPISRTRLSPLEDACHRLRLGRTDFELVFCRTD